jgi:hypothetical protein
MICVLKVGCSAILVMETAANKASHSVRKKDTMHPNEPKNASNDEYQACSGKTRECMFLDRGITPGPLRPAGAGGMEI